MFKLGFWTLFLVIGWSLILIAVHTGSSLKSFGSLANILTTLVVSYLFLFGPLAFWAAVTGQFMNRHWLILLPFWPILYFFKNFRLIFNSFFSILKESLFSIIVLCLLFFIYIVFILALSWLLIYYFNIKIVILLYSTLFLISIPLLVSGIKLAFHWIHDLLTLRQWIKSKRETMTCQDLFSTLGTYHTVHFRIHILKVVREERLLISTEETEAILSKIALEAEIRQQVNRYKKKDKSYSESKVSELTTANNNYKYIKLIINISPDLLDSLYVMLEDIRTIRQYELTHL